MSVWEYLGASVHSDRLLDTARYNPVMGGTLNEPIVRCTEDDPSVVSSDVLGVPVFADDQTDFLRRLDRATGGNVARGRASGEFNGKLHERFWTDVSDVSWLTRRVLLVGAGDTAQWSCDRARSIAATAGMSARRHAAQRVCLVCPPRIDLSGAHQALAEGLLLGAFRDLRFKSRDIGSGALTEVSLLVDSKQLSRAASEVERGVKLAHCVNLARELSNEPGNLFTPRVFASRALDLVTGPTTTVEVLDEREIAARGMGLLQGVAQGSSEPARVIVMRYEPPEAPEGGPVLGLVGKGVTFDTGGISIKPADGMDRMKRDMAGGAAVVCAMRAIGQLAPPIRVLGIVPATENMPGGRAIRPGDVLTAASGLRVEVLNTDAEGRLILADGLWLAQSLGATHLVDIATLTGACVVALGHHASGLVGTPTAWVDTVRRVADGAGERVWPLPTFDAYEAQLKSDTADLANIGGRAGGAITAGLFLRAFAGGLPWAHLDIAGTAWYEEETTDHLKGASGVGVRTLALLAFALASSAGNEAAHGAVDGSEQAAPRGLYSKIEQ